jgi:cytochrome c-type biogenesis protein CcmH
MDITAAKQQLQQLAEFHASGALSREAYDEGRTQLERRILDWVLRDASEGEAVGAPSAKPLAGPSRRLLTMLAGVVVLVAAAGYGWTVYSSSGAAGTVASGLEGGGATAGDGAGVGKPHATNFDQIAAMTEKLAVKLQDKPQDAEGWAMLARSYSVLGRNPEAIKAYEKAVALRADDAVLLADFADALAIKNNRSLAGEPMKLVERALKIDPRNLKALSLAGTHAFEKKDYAGAVKFWDQVVQFGAADNSFVEQVQPSLAEARQLAGLPPAAKVAAPAKPTADSAGQTVSGIVSLAPALSREAKPEDTVFIFARAAEGSRMPLAILRKQVKDLPIQFTLDDSMAMSPATKLSQAGRITVGARISKSGNAMPEPGDLAGQSSVVAVGSKGLSIEIREAFKP